MNNSTPLSTPLLAQLSPFSSSSSPPITPTAPTLTVTILSVTPLDSGDVVIYCLDGKAIVVEGYLQRVYIRGGGGGGKGLEDGEGVEGEGGEEGRNGGRDIDWDVNVKDKQLEEELRRRLEGYVERRNRKVTGDRLSNVAVEGPSSVSSSSSAGCEVGRQDYDSNPSSERGANQGRPPPPLNVEVSGCVGTPFYSYVPEPLHFKSLGYSVYGDSDLVTSFMRDLGVGGMGRISVSPYRVARDKVTNCRSEYRARYTDLRKQEEEGQVQGEGTGTPSYLTDSVVVGGVKEWRMTEYDRARGILPSTGLSQVFATPSDGVRKVTATTRCRQMDEAGGEAGYYDVAKRIVEEGGGGEGTMTGEEEGGGERGWGVMTMAQLTATQGSCLGYNDGGNFGTQGGGRGEGRMTPTQQAFTQFLTGGVGGRVGSMMTAMTGEGGDGDVEEGDIRELWEGLIRNSVEEGVVRVKDVEGLMGEGLGGMVLGTQEEGGDRKVEWEEFRDIVLEIREGAGLGDFGEFGEGIENGEDEGWKEADDFMTGLTQAKPMLDYEDDEDEVSGNDVVDVDEMDEGGRDWLKKRDDLYDFDDEEEEEEDYVEMKSQDFQGCLTQDFQVLQQEIPTTQQSVDVDNVDNVGDIVGMKEDPLTSQTPTSAYLELGDGVITIGRRMPTRGEIKIWRKNRKTKGRKRAEEDAIDSNSGKRVRVDEIDSDSESDSDASSSSSSASSSTSEPMKTPSSDKPNYTVSPPSSTKSGNKDWNIRRSQIPSTAKDNGARLSDDLGQQGGLLHFQGQGGVKKKATGSVVKMLTVEIHTTIRCSDSGVYLTPDVGCDEVRCCCWVLSVDKGTGEEVRVADRGCVQVKTDGDKRIKRELLEVKNGRDYAVEEVDCERALLIRVVGIIQHQDPDIVMSWDTLDSGLGYMLDRGDRLMPDPIDMAKLIGRTPRISAGANRLGNEWMDKTGPGGRTAAIVGRVGICVWRVMSSEVKHPNVSFLPACVGMILGEKLPWHDRGTLVKWWGERGGRERFRVTGWCMRNAETVVRLFDKLDVVGRTSEGSRLCCTDFSQMLPGIRGSQYKVEGVLQRALLTIGSDHALSPSSQQQQQMVSTSNPSNLPNVGYLFASPSKADIRNMEALESIPLVLEPESGFYHDPVVVCDFTALYPSIVIAYNLCYSTCAGKIEYRSTLRGGEARTTGRVGIMEVPHKSVRKVLKNHIFSNSDGAIITPSGSIFVQPSVRQGVLPRILSELLSTRAMIKRCQKAYKKSKSVPGGVIRTLEAKQLALKFISNVTYGYTSATFSGRCCCPLVADAIVEIARRTLAGAKERAEELGRGERWTGAKVVYGDTDSLFICLPGRTVGEAFDFGEEFCKSVTESNPPPVHLKLEKVYSSCMLQTKKKYCGMKFESRGQREGVWEAKGIETIRKDQCRLTQKLLRGALMTLFKYHNVEKLRKYLEREWTKLLAGKLPVSDFILSGRVRSHYREGGETVTAALVQRLSEKDPLIRNVRNKARIEYVIVAMPGTDYRIKHGVRTPLELIEGGDHLVVHLAYYATRQLNSALDRAFRLPPYNLSIASWFDNCPKPRKAASFWPAKTGSSTIFQFFGSDTCCMCGSKTKAKGSNKAVVCESCSGEDTAIGGVSLGFARLKRATKEGSRLAKICSDCNGCIDERGFAYDRGGGKGVNLPLAVCVNTDCEAFHKRHKYREMELEAEAICNAFNVLQF
ncbi:hypothetical protein TrCOL_g2571 [Triparma columacea]|uniref:DNA polymerase n=1 Tax=Triparma columacea TaxID=722753 RepID=A0A9W7LED0_9STRA|nr:hypothetical protein TrCOL_g2571 [Triparma columacea]